MNELTEKIVAQTHKGIAKVLDTAKAVLPTEHQFQAFRKITLDAFGNESFLPELDAICEQYERKGKAQAKTARKEVQ